MARFRAQTKRDEAAFVFLTDGENPCGEMSYAELDRQARAIASGLCDRGAKGQRVLLLCEPGEDFIAALFGCMYAGALAVPVYPPDPLRLSRTLPRLQAVLRNAQARYLVGSREVLDYARGSFEQWDDVQLLPLDRLVWDDDDQWFPEVHDPEELAFLQYTSGSTGSPRGIMLTHGNLMNSLATMHREDIEGAVGVNWLPPYHDMGLVGGILLPFYAGRPTVMMPPRAFIERPMRWLQAISRYRATSSGGPNFAYDLCVRKVRAGGLPGAGPGLLEVGRRRGPSRCERKPWTGSPRRSPPYGFPPRDLPAGLRHG